MRDTVVVVLSILVIKDDVWQPDVSGGNMETVHPAVLLGVPAQLVVVPVLLDPQVGRHHLLPQVLQQQLSQLREGGREGDNNQTKMVKNFIKVWKCFEIFKRNV